MLQRTRLIRVLQPNESRDSRELQIADGDGAVSRGVSGTRRSNLRRLKHPSSFLVFSHEHSSEKITASDAGNSRFCRDLFMGVLGVAADQWVSAEAGRSPSGGVR